MVEHNTWDYLLKFTCLHCIQKYVLLFNTYLQSPNSEWASQLALVVKNLPANTGDQEMRVQSLGREDALEEGMATNSSIFAWRIPWTEEPGRLQFMGSQRVRHNWAAKQSSTWQINI